MKENIQFSRGTRFSSTHSGEDRRCCLLNLGMYSPVDGRIVRYGIKHYWKTRGGQELLKNMHNVLESFFFFFLSIYFWEQFYCIESIYISRYVRKAV